MKVTVTQEHIDAGRPGDPCGCALALAIEDAAPEFSVVVSSFSIGLYEGVGDGVYTRAARAGHTEQTARFVHEFDAGNPVEPFTFELDWGQP